MDEGATIVPWLVVGPLSHESAARVTDLHDVGGKTPSFSFTDAALVRRPERVTITFQASWTAGFLGVAIEHRSQPGAWWSRAVAPVSLSFQGRMNRRALEGLLAVAKQADF
ncbi:MAG: DUF1990 domain-containing protein [Thermoplasmatota archaeon]